MTGDDTLHNLLQRYLDGLAEPSELAELAHRIVSDVDARERFWDAAEVDAVLEKWGEELEQVRTGDQVLSVVRREAAAEGAVRRPSLLGRTAFVAYRVIRREPMVSSFAATLILVVGLALLAVLRGPSSQLGANNYTPNSPGQRVAAAQLGPTFNAVWALPAEHARAGDPDLADATTDRGPQSLRTSATLFAGDRLRLTSGVAEIDFANGARALIEGPASLTVNGLSLCALESGRLRAVVETQSARGFIVQTPAATITDLGTEFGVDVINAQATDVTVFRGQVLCQASSSNNGTPAPMTRIAAGSAVTVASGSSSMRPLAQADFQMRFASGRSSGPRLVRVFPAADIRIHAGESTRSEGRSELLSVYNNDSNVQRTVLAFTLPDRQPGLKIARARLLLFRPSSGDESKFSNPEKLPTEVYRVTTRWTESGATWLKATLDDRWSSPGGDAVGLGGQPLKQPFAMSTANPDRGQAIEWDVTDLVTGWYEGGTPNYGMLLLSYPHNGLHFRSRESTTREENPRLEIELVPVDGQKKS